MKLNTITLLGTDTCFTYVLRRLGIFHQYVPPSLNVSEYSKVREFLEQHGHIPSRPWVEGISLMTGDIICWYSKKPVLMPRTITGDGHILTELKAVDYHFGIVEQNPEYYSDVTRMLIPYTPTLQMKKIGDWWCKRNPDIIFTLDSSIIRLPT